MYFVKRIKLSINILKRHYTSTKLKPPWNVLFFGSDHFSLASLENLNLDYKNSRCISNLEVVTGPKINPIRKYALKEKLKLHDWPYEPPQNHVHDLGIVVSFGHLIPESVINMFPLGMLNVHASLLPRWRGAAPIIYALANGDKVTGITIMKIKPNKFDVGEILMQEKLPLDDVITQPELYRELAELGANTLLNCLRKLPQVLDNCREQPQEGVTTAPRIKPTMANVSWSKMTAEEVYNLFRALCGIHHLTTTWNDISVKLINIRRTSINDSKSVVPGRVSFSRNENVLNVQCKDGGWISVEKIGVINKKPMTAKEFYNGYVTKQFDIGDRRFK